MQTTSNRVLRPKDAARYLGVGLTTVYELIKFGDLPKPITIHGNARGLPVEDLDALIDRRKRERDAEGV